MYFIVAMLDANSSAKKRGELHGIPTASPSPTAPAKCCA